MRIQYIFRHLDQSEFLKKFAQDHIERLLSRYKGTPNINSVIKLEMENSPEQPGKDVFSCEILLSSPQLGKLIVKKRTANMYEAIAEATDKLSMSMEKVKGRFLSKRRKSKSAARKVIESLQAPLPY